MIKVRGLAFVLVCLVLVQTVFAFSVIETTPITDRIEFSEKAEFEVEVSNRREVKQTYEMFSTVSPIQWAVQTRPLSDQIFTLEPGETKKVLVTVEPIEKFNPGFYLVNAIFRTNFGEQYERSLKVFMGPTEPKDYLPSIRTTIDMNDRIDPRETQSIKVTVENLNPLDLSDLVLETTSEIEELHLMQQIELPPGPGSRRTVDFSFKLSDTQQPKEYFVFFQFKKGNETIKIVDERIEIRSIIPEFTQVIEEEENFLKTTKRITYTNDGNVRNKQTVSHQVSAFESLFTTTDPQTTVVKEEDARSLVWDVELGPNKDVTVVVTTSYRLPAFIILLILIGVLLYHVYKAPIALTKSASNVVQHHGGAVSGLKVTLMVKNMSNKVIKDIEIKDKIPGITDVEKNVEMGTLKPSKIIRTKRGSTYVKWKLSELEPKEERLISYKIKSKLNIVGTVQLTRAKVTYHAGRRKRVVYSNTYRVSTDSDNS